MIDCISGVEDTKGNVSGNTVVAGGEIINTCVCAHAFVCCFYSRSFIVSLFV